MSTRGIRRLPVQKEASVDVNSSSSKDNTQTTSTRKKVLKKVENKQNETNRDTTEVVSSKSASKSDGKSDGKVPSKSASKVPSKSASKSDSKSDSKVPSKKVTNSKPTTLDSNGIGIGPARVKSLVYMSINPLETAARTAITNAENKTRKPKPNESNPDTSVEVPAKQTPINELSSDTLDVINRAEAHHKNGLRRQYERSRLSSMEEDKLKNYNTARKEAQNEHSKSQAQLPESNRVNFSLFEFNNKYDSNFYDGLEKYISENDNYSLSNTDGKNAPKYNQWSRANALVNKLCTRLSGNTRNLIASFLDCIVEQYAVNGIHNCMLEGRHIVQIRHAMNQTEGFSSRVPLNPFVSTFSNYNNSLLWLEQCNVVKEQVKQARANNQDTKLELPEFPDPNYGYCFSGYVNDICRSVRNRVSDEQTNEADKLQCLNTSISREFKKFCSYVVYEAILRLGSFLRRTVDRSNVKTISDSMVLYTLEQVHNVCGIDYSYTASVMNVRLEKFVNWKNERKLARRVNRVNE